jgi:hypothetical protein
LEVERVTNLPDVFVQFLDACVQRGFTVVAQLNIPTIRHVAQDLLPLLHDARAFANYVDGGGQTQDSTNADMTYAEFTTADTKHLVVHMLAWVGLVWYTHLPLNCTYIGYARRAHLVEDGGSRPSASLAQTVRSRGS